MKQRYKETNYKIIISDCNIEDESPLVHIKTLLSTPDYDEVIKLYRLIEEHNFHSYVDFDCFKDATIVYITLTDIRGWKYDGYTIADTLLKKGIIFNKEDDNMKPNPQRMKFLYN